MSLIENQIQVLLASLSAARAGATVGPWMNAPDLAGWLLREGRSFPWRQNLSKYEGTRLGRVGHCYRDAQDMALVHGGFTYCEGYAQLGCEVPVPHGWVITRDGQVVDTTWRQLRTPNRSYFGVPFQTPFVRLFQQKPGTELSILLWSEAGWPVQSGLLHPSEWRREFRCHE